MENQKYIVGRVSPNSWHGDGSPIFERICAHQHRTISGARRCQIRLLDYSRDGYTHSAAWHNSKIYHEDRTPLSEEECEELYEIDF